MQFRTLVAALVALPALLAAQPTGPVFTPNGLTPPATAFITNGSPVTITFHGYAAAFGYHFFQAASDGSVARRLVDVIPGARAIDGVNGASVNTVSLGTYAAGTSLFFGTFVPDAGVPPIYGAAALPAFWYPIFNVQPGRTLYEMWFNTPNRIFGTFFSMDGIERIEDPGCTINTCAAWRDAGSTLVPEPSTYALFAAGLAGIAAVSRRRRAA
jgi:hypothetical protein